MKGRVGFAALAGLVFVVELVIASGRLGRGFVRGSVGDILVIVLLHFTFRTASLARGRAAALAVVAGFAVEGLQYLHLADALGIRKGSVLAIVIGSTASVGDLGMYVAGGLLALVIDRLLFSEPVADVPSG